MFHVVLIEPEIPPNTGNIIRLCANTGARLHLVKPLGFRLDERKLQRAGLDYHDLADVRIHDDLPACLAALQGSRTFIVETGGTRRYSDARFERGDALIFGSETRGLSDAVKRSFAAGSWLSIPMANGTRSLNLSNAVALVLYEAWRQLDFPGL
jgi:tRNA (cytidine/uridine-2'-O-)-methyltransferase